MSPCANEFDLQAKRTRIKRRSWVKRDVPILLLSSNGINLTTELPAFGRAATMKRLLIALAFVECVWLAPDVTIAQATPCRIVTLTGTHGGPQQPFNGLASAGTLVRNDHPVLA
jgi:hypothetical protein